MSIQKITNDEIYNNSLERLSDRPTSASRSGVGGLSPSELKAAYEKLARLAIVRINALIDALHADASDTTALLREIMTPVEVTEDGDTNYLSLYTVLSDLTSGVLSSYLGLSGHSGDTLDEECTALENAIAALSGALDDKADEGTNTASHNAITAALASAVSSLNVTISGKVAKDGDKVLSDNNFSNNLKNKLDNIESGAQVNVKPDFNQSNSSAADYIKNKPDIGTTGDAADAAGSIYARIKKNKALADAAFKDVAYTASNGIVTFTLNDGSTKTIDLPLELIVSSGYFDNSTDAPKIVLTLANGSTVEIPFDDFADALMASVNANTTALAGKTDKPVSPTAGNLAGLTDDGNLTDSGVSADRVAVKDGYYSEMTVAAAETLVGNGTPTNERFIYRAAGGDTAISDGVARIKTIKGNTVVWNQIHTMYEQLQQTGLAQNGITLSKNSDGTIQVNGTATATNSFSIGVIALKAGHKYLVKGLAGTALMHYLNDVPGAVCNDTDKIINVGDTDVLYTVAFNTGASFDGVTICPQCHDLTMMFGAGNEPNVSAFKALYPDDYYAFNAGSLLSFMGGEIKITEFNQYNGTYAAVLAANAYVIEGTYTGLGFTRVLGGATTPITAATDGDCHVFTPDKNGFVYVEGGAADTCIHLKRNGGKNGIKKTYKTQTRAIDLSDFNVTVGGTVYGGMKSVGTISDEISTDKNIRRIGARTYTDGDYTDTTVLTDGTVTYYVLQDAVETIHNTLNLTYNVSFYSTEQIITDNGIMTAPCNIDVSYGLNAVDTLLGLPHDYVSAKQQTLTAEQKEAARNNIDAALSAHTHTASQISDFNEAVRLVNTSHYTVKWNKTLATMERMNDAANITVDITDFTHRGSINPNYSNPFDDIYPWSGRKLCNIDIDWYRALTAGHSLTECVKAWEGDVDFSYTDTNGVWVYTPEFWGKSWDDGTYRYFDVADEATNGHIHYPESIEGRWHGRTATITIGDAAKTCLVPTVGMPAKSFAMSTLHTYAKNWGATLDSIFSIDASTLLMVVEFATMNSQSAIGEGVDNMYRQSSDLIAADATASTVVKVVKSAGSAYCIPGAIFDIGTKNGGTNVGSYLVESVETDAGDNTLLDVTLNAAVTVTTAHYWSVHGLANVADEAIGSKSGYIGTNGKCSAYYRGEVLFGNMFFYILGAYRQTGTQHVFIANNEEEADAADALNAAVHYDTGITLSSTEGYANTLGMLSRSGLLAIPPFCTAVGGSSSAPVGDYHYISAGAGNTVLLRGGHATDGSADGAFYGHWRYTASTSNWYFAARPRLKKP